MSPDPVDPAYAELEMIVARWALRVVVTGIIALLSFMAGVAAAQHMGCLHG